jgi:hypothetical protein
VTTSSRCFAAPCWPCPAHHATLAALTVVALFRKGRSIVAFAVESKLGSTALRMFRSAMLAMPRSSSKFGRDLQAALVPMLNKPSNSCSVVLSLGMYDSAEAGDHILQCLYRRRHAKSQCISDYLLKMFRSAMLAMPRSSSKFGRDLQAALVPSRHSPWLHSSGKAEASWLSPSKAS